MRVYGNFKGAQADRPNELGQMVAYSVRAIQDHNEVRCLLLLSCNFSGIVHTAAYKALLGIFLVFFLYCIL